MNQNAASQVERFVNRFEDTPDNPDPDAPLVVFPGALVLNRDQEDSLVEHAMKRIETLEKELGRNVTYGSNWFTNAEASPELGARTFMGGRELYTLIYNNEVEWREYLLGGIYEDSNLVIPITRRIVQQQIARATGYFFGTDPWLSLNEVGAKDADLDSELAHLLEGFLKFKFGISGVKDQLVAAIAGAFIRGESVVKTTYNREVDYYEEVATIAVDAGGNPILTLGGDHIFEDDDWVSADDGAGVVLARDRSTPQPQGFTWATMPIRRRIIHQEGAEANTIYYKDFLAPLDAPSLQKADCLVHLYDLPAIQIAEQWLEHSRQAGALEGDLPTVLGMLRDMSAESGSPKSQSAQPRQEIGQATGDTEHERMDPVVEVAELCIRFDAKEEGHRPDIFLVLDRKNKRPVHYDYVINHTEDGLRPYRSIRINPVDDRWHGIGQVQNFLPIQEICDLLVNRINFSQSRCARVDFWQPDSVVEGDTNENLELNWGGTYELKEGKEAKDALESVYLQDIKHDILKEQLDMFMQVAVNWGGVQHANDASMSGMDSTDLATGIRNIEKSGQELFAPFIDQLLPGVTKTVDILAVIEIANMSDLEEFEYFEGEEVHLAEITRDQARKLRYHLELEMTRYKSEQELASALEASNVVEKFYNLPFPIQQKTARMFREMLKAFQVKNVDLVIDPIDLGGYGMQPGIDPAAAAQAVPKSQSTQSEPNL